MRFCFFRFHRFSSEAMALSADGWRKEPEFVTQQCWRLKLVIFVMISPTYDRYTFGGT